MLVLTRKTGEKIVIHTTQGDITITVVELRGTNAIRLGFDAPRDIVIAREEVDDAS